MAAMQSPFFGQENRHSPDDVCVEQLECQLQPPKR
jgi:hypothetical protein